MGIKEGITGLASAVLGDTVALDTATEIRGNRIDNVRDIDYVTISKEGVYSVKTFETIVVDDGMAYVLIIGNHAGFLEEV